MSVEQMRQEIIEFTLKEIGINPHERLAELTDSQIVAEYKFIYLTSNWD